MGLIGFADESGTSAGSPCYTIGILSVPEEKEKAFIGALNELRVQHGFQGEAKWTRVRNGHGLINFGISVLDIVLRSKTVCYDAIVVNKEMFRNWQGTAVNQENAFYQTYTYLLRHVIRRANETTTVIIDDRSDSYKHRTEMVETIGNHMLVQLQASGRIRSIQKVDSSEVIAIQAADLITGAITSSHICALQPKTKLHIGKQIAIERMSAILGWDNLYYDTFPHPRFNIWHFPQEYRAFPASMDPKYTPPARYIAPEDIT